MATKQRDQEVYADKRSRGRFARLELLHASFRVVAVFYWSSSDNEKRAGDDERRAVNERQRTPAVEVGPCREFGDAAAASRGERRE
jgi:hypothetical protein